MSAELTDLLGFRFEMWQIEFYKSTLGQLAECSRVEDRVKIMRRISLVYMFLQRFSEDPGFRWHVMEKVYLSENGHSLRIIERLVEELADKVHGIGDRAYEMFAGCPTSGKTLLGPKLGSRDLPMSDSKEEVLEELAERAEGIIEFLSRRLEIARKGNDRVGVKAISCLVTEYSMGCLTGITLLLPAYPLEEESLNIGQWLTNAKRFIVCRVKHPSAYRYGDDLDRLLQRNLAVLLASPRMLPLKAVATFPRLMKYFVDKLNEKMKQRDVVDRIKRTLFVDHVTIIASVTWFNELSEEERLAQLNRYYPFEIKDDLLEDFNSIFGVVILFNMAALLLKTGFLNESITIYLYLSARPNDPSHKYLSCIKLAKAHLMLGEINRAAEYLAEALHVPESLARRSNLMLLNELMISREIEYRLGHRDRAEEALLNLEKGLKVLQGDEKISVSMNLIESLRRTSNFEKEYWWLCEIANSEPEVLGNRGSDNKILSRLDTLSKRKIEIKGGSLDNDASLLYLSNKMACDDFAVKGRALHDSFQFEAAVKWYERTYIASNDPGVLSAIGMSYFDWAQFDSSRYTQSKEYFQRAILMSPTGDTPQAYLRLIELITGNKTGALEKLGETLALGFYRGEHDSPLFILVEKLVCHSPRDLHDIIARLSEQVAPSEKSIYYNNVGIAYTKLGYAEEAINYFESALNSEITPETRAIVLGNMGINHMKQGHLEDALNYLHESLAIRPSNMDFQINMALIYLSRLEGTKALECIDRAIGIVPSEKASILKGIRTVCEAFARNALKVHLVTDEEVSHELRNVEVMFHYLTMGEETRGYDLRGLFTHYSFALESILQRKISSRILEPLKSWILKEEYGSRARAGDLMIHEQYRSGNKMEGISPLPTYIRDLIRNRSISVGGWAGVLTEPHLRPSNPIENRFKDLVDEILTVEEIRIIKEACDVISSYWNPMHHPSSDPGSREMLRRAKSRAEIIEMRKDIVVQLNRVIDVFYSRGKRG